MQGKIDDKNNYMTNEKIKKAYEILGVREGAGRDEIERRYFLLAKKHLILQRENLKSEVVGLNMEKINEAYYLLIGLHSHDTKKLLGSDDEELSSDKMAQKLKVYIRENIGKVIAVFIIVLIGAVILLFSDSNNYINIVIFGEYENNLRFIKAFESKNTIINRIFRPKNVKIQEFVLSENLPLPYKLEMMLAAYKFVTQGDYHVLIMDRESFIEYGTVANIAKLDEIINELGLDKGSYFTIKKPGIDEKEHIYALNAAHIINGYDFTQAEDSLEDTHVIAFREGLDYDIIKLVIEAMHLLIEQQ
ncbi:MAG TPA: J domain-containing protein [Clostridiaceae bacterium]|nr:J domain-containing protein [Clostridiaceae bacterium]